MVLLVEKKVKDEKDEKGGSSGNNNNEPGESKCKERKDKFWDGPKCCSGK